MGVVYRAREQALDREVALKVLPTQFAEDADAVRRLRQEAQAAARLNHPSIVKVHRVGEWQGTHYISMQYVRGRDVRNLIREEGPFSVKNALAGIRQVADGLVVAHGQKLIHRDIKPQNIMVNERGRFLLMDFGLARPIQRTTTQTVQGAVLGTPLYMSPEQVQARDLDGRTDLYSLGITLYEMLIGRPPFQAPSALALMYQILHEPLPDVSQLNPNIPREVAVLLAKMTAKNRDERHPSSRALCEDLEAISSGQAATISNGPVGFMGGGDSTASMVDDLLGSTPVASISVPEATNTIWDRLAVSPRTIGRALLAFLVVSGLIGVVIATRAMGAFAPKSEASPQESAVNTGAMAENEDRTDVAEYPIVERFTEQERRTIYLDAVRAHLLADAAAAYYAPRSARQYVPEVGDTFRARYDMRLTNHSSPSWPKGLIVRSWELSSSLMMVAAGFPFNMWTQGLT